ncbi:unnamed protein product [Clonostachys chloroleuca]|uniref:Uncharacterized protein n=1 Tax=Clonostachys chloroleuca TaxID=1926264 RepID=A0AA35MIV9_9HYPO|nr:unnamed protein product [Clonostachys chloroleuca]
MAKDALAADPELSESSSSPNSASHTGSATSSTESSTDPPSSTAEGNLDKTDPDTPSQIPGRSFRPGGSNTTVLKGDEGNGDPPIPAIIPKSQAHTLQQQLRSVLSGLALLFATVA